MLVLLVQLLLLSCSSSSSSGGGGGGSVAVGKNFQPTVRACIVSQEKTTKNQAVRKKATFFICDTM